MTSTASRTDSPSLFTGLGQRKYLTQSECTRFVDHAAEFDLATATLASLLVCSGCRLSEALQLTRFQLDPQASSVVFRTLKRREEHYRAVPIPAALMDMLYTQHHRQPDESRLWLWSRQHGWRRIKAVMTAAGIHGPHATPRGLRHTFGVACALKRIDPAITQRLMGHSKLDTTAIYLEVMNEEAFELLKAMWAQFWFSKTMG